MIVKLRPKFTQKASLTLSEVFLDNYPMNSRFAESYRTLRTNIHFAFMDKEFRSLLVTSAGEREGKTSTVANLSYTMALAGKTVLMVDTDLRKPALSRLGPSKDSKGITALLAEAFSTDIQSGSLGEFGVSDLFRLVSFQKKTGSLHLSDGKEKIHIYFLQGEPADVHHLTRAEEQRLGALLVRNKLLTKDQAEQALTRQGDTQQRLGFILLNMGLVKEDELAGFITLHMIEGLRTAMQFKSGTFSFQHLPESHFEHPSFDPVDLSKLYRQVIIGEEELPYLQEKIHDAIIKTNVDNLFILPSGPRTPNPAELLESNRMSFLLSYLKRRFDRIILDSSPVLPASDAVLLSPQTDGVVLMVKPGEVNRELVEKAVRQLQVAEANLVGVVLNEVDVNRDGYYKYYYKYYSKYYGEDK